MCSFLYTKTVLPIFGKVSLKSLQKLSSIMLYYIRTILKARWTIKINQKWLDPTDWSPLHEASQLQDAVEQWSIQVLSRHERVL